MASDEGERKLAAILSADVAGYSKLMGDDERATVLTLTDYRDVFGDHIARHKGRVIDSPGDNLLAEFASPVEAVDAAIDIQHELGRRNRQLAEHRQMRYRIGLNLGDVIAKDDGTIYGDGVNIAARLEGLAEPGGICISGTVFDQVKGKVAHGLDYFGEHEVKNIAEPVRAYRVMLEGAHVPAAAKRSAGMRNASIGAVAVAAALAVGGLILWQLYGGPASEQTAQVDPATDSVLALPSGPSIAVLPFENLSGNPEQDYFATGLATDISIQLSFERDLKVIGRSSTAKYAHELADIRDIGRDLGVQYVLKGSVRRDQQTIRVTAELLETEAGSQVWAQTFDRDLDAASLFAVQDEITHQVVGTIADEYGIISRLVRKDMRERPSIELSSYECVLLGHAYFEKITLETHLRARDCLEAAVVRDPDYADAWGWLAIIYAHEISNGLNPLPGSLERSMAAAQAGIKADPSNQMAWEGMSAARYFRHERDKFMAAAKRAVAINPNDVSTIANIGFYYGTWGMYEEGLPLLKKAIAMSPFPVWWYYYPLFNEAYSRQDYKEALGYAHKGTVDWYFMSKVQFSATYAQLGQMDDAKEEIRKLLELKPDVGETFREYTRMWNMPPTLTEELVDGLRKAGLDIPDEPTTTD